MGSPHQLAIIARRLNRDAGSVGIPALFFLTDPERTPDPVRAIKRLPRGTVVIYRHFGSAERARTARRLVQACRVRSLMLLIAADPELAMQVRADGVHWPERLLEERAEPGLLVTAAAHSAEGVQRAAAFGVDACLLAPIFHTRSHSGRPPLGLFRASQIARASTIPVIALGGVNQRNASLLAGRGFSGVAAVDGLRRA